MATESPPPSLNVCTHCPHGFLQHACLGHFSARKKVTQVTQECEGTRVCTQVKTRLGKRNAVCFQRRRVGQRRGTRVKTVTACTLATWPALKKITSSPLCRGELREQRAELGWRRLQLWGPNLPPFSFASKIKHAPTMIRSSSWFTNKLIFILSLCFLERTSFLTG